MKRMFLTISLASLVTGISAQESGEDSTTAPAQKVPPEISAAAPQPTQLSPFNKASSFIGAAIQAPDGKPLGKVQDLVFDLERGELAYAVIALDGGNGKTRHVAVPTRALKPAAAHLVLNITESVLAAAEGLQEGNWPGTDIFAIGRPAEAETGTGISSAETQ